MKTPLYIRQAVYGITLSGLTLLGCASTQELHKPTQIEQDFQEYRELSTQLKRSLKRQGGLMQELAQVKAAIDVGDAHRDYLSKAHRENPKADLSILLQNLQNLQTLMQGTSSFWEKFAQTDSLATLLIRNTENIFDLEKRMLEIEGKYERKK